eukprot:4978-Heterococcus_DN1.PRE.2
MSVTGATRQCVTCHCQHVGAQINPLQYNQKVKRSTYHVNSTVAHVSRAHAPASNMCTLHQYMSRLAALGKALAIASVLSPVLQPRSAITVGGDAPASFSTAAVRSRKEFLSLSSC